MAQQHLLEDPDGAPYPDEVQQLVGALRLRAPLGTYDDLEHRLVDALESVARPR